MEHILQKRIPCFKRWSRKGWSVFASLHRYVKIGVLAAGMSILLLATRGASAHNADTTAVLRTLRIREVGITGTQTAPVRNARSHTPLFRPESFRRGARPDAGGRSAPRAFGRYPRTRERERRPTSPSAEALSTRRWSFSTVLISRMPARGHQSHALPVDLDCISSVELLDGLPGVGAFAGAVNVRTAPLRPTYLRFEGAGGQYGYAYANLSGAVTEGRLSVLGAASFRRSDGYRHNTDFSNCNAYVRAVCEAPVPDCSISRPDTRTGISGPTDFMRPTIPTSGNTP